MVSVLFNIGAPFGFDAARIIVGDFEGLTCAFLRMAPAAAGVGGRKFGMGLRFVRHGTERWLKRVRAAHGWNAGRTWNLILEGRRCGGGGVRLEKMFEWTLEK